MNIKIVGIDGAARSGSATRKLLKTVGQAIEQKGVQFALFSQDIYRLPIYDGDPETAKVPAVQALFQKAKGVDAFVLSSPEYHGSMSGALKNALDWLNLAGDEVETAGRVFGLIGGGGALANSGATLQMMMSVRALHGWLMPDVVVSVSNIWDVVGVDAVNPDADSTRARIESFATKMVRYAEEFKIMRERLAA